MKKGEHLKKATDAHNGGRTADRHWKSFVGRTISNPATDIGFHSYDGGQFTVRHYSGNPDEYLEFVGTPEEVAEAFGFSKDVREKFFDMGGADPAVFVKAGHERRKEGGGR